MRNTPFVKPAGFQKRPCRFIAKPLVSQKWHGLPQGAAVPLRTNYSFRDSSLLHDREHGNAHARCCFGIHSRGAGTLALYLFSQLHLHTLEHAVGDGQPQPRRETSRPQIHTARYADVAQKRARLLLFSPGTRGTPTRRTLVTKRHENINVTKTRSRRNFVFWWKMCDFRKRINVCVWLVKKCDIYVDKSIGLPHRCGFNRTKTDPQKTDKKSYFWAVDGSPAPP